MGNATASHTNGHLEVFKLLLNKGADIKVKEGGNGSGWTVLQMAADNGSLEVFKLR